MNNTAAIVEGNGARELQLNILTKAEHSDRMWVLMTVAQSHLAMIEHVLAEMPQEEHDKLRDELKRLEAEDAEPNESTPKILMPGEDVLSLVTPTATMPDTPTGFKEE